MTRSSRRALALVAALVLLLAAGWLARQGGLAREQAVPTLDPARIILLRTPGGFLEAGSMEKVEEFGWSSRYTCPIQDCPALLPPTISRIRVRAHYVYRVPLAAEWTLRLAGDHYELAIPALQLQEPVAFDTTDLQIQTTRGGWFAPPAAPNREAVVRHLGPELARRGAQPDYLAAQRPNAEKTIEEFATRWMLEQGGKARLPIRVRIAAPAGL